MKRLLSSVTAAAVVASVLMLPVKGHAISFFTDRDTWEAAVQQVQPVDIANQLGNFVILTAGQPLLLPFSEEFTFNIALQRLQVPTSWATWSAGETPAVLFTQFGSGSLIGTFGPDPVVAFGLEIEPNLFAVFNISLTTADGETHVLTQSVNGLAGAKFFGWVGDVNSMQITCSSNCAGDGFAIGELFIGGFAGTPGKPNCHGKSVSALAQKYGGLPTAATTLGFSSVQALQDAIKSFCGA
jgi:hypothetical protein